MRQLLLLVLNRRRLSLLLNWGGNLRRTRGRTKRIALSLLLRNRCGRLRYCHVTKEAKHVSVHGLLCSSSRRRGRSTEQVARDPALHSMRRLGRGRWWDSCNRNSGIRVHGHVNIAKGKMHL